MTVEKGLLREVSTLQKLLVALLECKFYLDDREDEVTMTALKLLVKDLLMLFTSVNEGVINVLGERGFRIWSDPKHELVPFLPMPFLTVLCASVLARRLTEHYFEMSHSDAKNALKIYKQFCKQTERVVTFLGSAKKMQSILNVQIPNLKHVSWDDPFGRCPGATGTAIDLCASDCRLTGSCLARGISGGVPHGPELRGQQTRVQAKPGDR